MPPSWRMAATMILVVTTSGPTQTMGFSPTSSMGPNKRLPSFTAVGTDQVWNGNLPPVPLGLETGNTTGMVSASLLGMVLALIGIGFWEEPRASATTVLPLPVKATDRRFASRPAKSLLDIFGTGEGEDRERLKLNYNDGRSPYGFKANAEIWNGRIAMAVMQKGLIEGIQCGDPHALGALSLFVAMLTTFTGIIDSDDSKDFVERVVDKDKLVQNLQRNWKPETTKPPYEPLPSLCLQDPSCRGSDPPTFEAYMRHRTTAEEQLKMTRDLQLMTSETHADRRPREYQWLPVQLEASIQNYEMTREGQAQGQSQSPSSFPVDGYRFKTSTQAALGASNASPHPDGVFHFKTETDRLIKEEGRKFARKSPRTPKKPSPPATTYPVEGYRFNKENQKMVVSPHPGGVFGFSSDNSLLIKLGAGKPTEIEKAAPSPTDVTPHPVEGFNFGRDTISVIKSDTRNRSVPLEKGRHRGRFYFPTGKVADTIQVPLEDTSITRDSSYLDGLNSSFGASSVDGIAIATNDSPTGQKGPDKTEGQLKSDNMASSPHASTVQAKSEDAAFSISMDYNGDAANQSISDDQSSTPGRSLDFTTIPQKPKATRDAGAGSVLDSPVTFGGVVEPIVLGEESQLAVEIEAALGSYYNPVGGGSYLDALNRNTAGEDTQPPWLDEQEPVGAYGFGSSFPETLTARWEGGNSQWFP